MHLSEVPLVFFNLLVNLFFIKLFTVNCGYSVLLFPRYFGMFG